MKNRKVLITGGYGFIGASRARQLVDNDSVIIIDNLSPGKKENIKDRLEETLNSSKGK